ncbi:MAG: hypothetical protein QW728_04885 [Thermoplasmata archaeon]
MKCGEIYRILTDIMNGKEVSGQVAGTLINMELIQRKPSADSMDAELADAKNRLNQVKTELHYLKINPRDRVTNARIEELTKQEAALRSRILTLIQKGAGAEVMAGDGTTAKSQSQYIVTYKGKDILQTLEARMPGIENTEWEEFSKSLSNLKMKLDSEAAESAEILKQISSQLSQFEQFHLRNAAIGLASIEGTPADKSARFVEYVKSFLKNHVFTPSQVITAAECALAYEVQNGLTRDAMLQAMSDSLAMIDAAGFPQADDRVPLCIIFMGKQPAEREKYMDLIKFYNPYLNTPLGCLLLNLDLAEGEKLEARIDLYQQWMNYITPLVKAGETREAVISSALLSTADEATEEVGPKFEHAYAYLKDLFEETMVVPAATIALWPSSVEESLDYIRIASSSVLSNKLSIGGVENFSLGMKLLVNNTQFVSRSKTGGTLEDAVKGKTAAGASIVQRDTEKHVGVLGGAAGAAAIAVGGVAVAATVATAAILASPILQRASFTIFHALTVQEHAFVDFRYHPTHSHYSYG